jgi:glc operon protein GlcG
MINWKQTTAALALAALPTSAFGAGVYQEDVLSLSAAHTIVAGCVEFAVQNDLVPLSMAVYDQHGNLKLFLRQDGAMTVTVEFAHIKARTAAVLGMATGALGDDVEFDDKDRPMGISYMDNLTVVQGGVPVRSPAGVLLGGMGVSGAPSEMDEACARAGLEAVQPDLR